MTQPARYQLRLLGPICIEQIQDGAEERSAGQVPRFRSRRTAALLGYLVSHQRPFARDLLAALFWPHWDLSRGRANLRRDLHNLAKILPDCWKSDRQMVAFVSSANIKVDLYQLYQLEAQERWVDAAALLCGEFMEGLYLDDNLEFESWLFDERERWRERSETILRRVINGHTRRGRYSEALNHANRLLRLAPWDEGTHRQIMRLLAWTGQRGAAMRQFGNCTRALREELDVEPTTETIALHRQIQTGELGLPPQLPAFLTEEKARHAVERPPFVGREEELARLNAFLDAAVAGKGRVVFITGGPGRGKTALLDAFARQAMEKHPALLVANGKCNAYAGMGDPYLPFRDVMAMLTGDLEGRWDAGAITSEHARRLWAEFSLVVQSLLDHGPQLLDVLVPGSALMSRSTAVGELHAPWLRQLREQVEYSRTKNKDVEQGHLFQQFTNVLRTVVRERPLLLILDDIQWADAASISLLFHLGRRLDDVGSRLLIACAYRPEEVVATRVDVRHPLAKALSEFKRDYGDGWVDLAQLEEREDRHFVDALLDVEANRLGDVFRTHLFERTGGHPLFTVELLRAMQDRGDLIKNADGAWIEGAALDWVLLPARVEAVLEERIERLDPELQDILTTASVEGELFTAQVVAEVNGIPERAILRRLSQNLERQHRLVREQEEVYTGQKRLLRYRFGHILFQGYLYGRLSRGELRLLHGEVAEVLEYLHRGYLDEIAVTLAQHYYRAGDQRQAFHYYCLAAERAARLFASGEAIAHFDRAIQLADTLSPDAVTLTNLHRGRGLASETVGDFERARADHEAILRIAGSAGERLVEWRALLDLGKLWRSRDYTRAFCYFESALELARRSGDPAVLASSLNWMGNWYANDEQPFRAVELHQEALSLAEQWEDRRELANTLDLLGIANLLGGDINTSITYYDRAITLFRELGDRPRLTTSLMGRATAISLLVWLACVPAASSPDAASDFDEVLRIAGEIDSAPDKAWAYWSSSLYQTVRGDFGRALAAARHGLNIASHIGHREFVVANKFALGILYCELFDPASALGPLEEALSLARALHSATMTHLVTGALAGAYLLLEDLGLVRSCLDKVISHDTPMDTVGKRYCWVRRAELALAQHDAALAWDIIERLITSARGMSSGQVITFLWMLKAEMLAEDGRLEDADSLLQSAIGNAQASGEQFLLWRVHANRGYILRAEGRLVEAEHEYMAARTLIDRLAATIPDKNLQGKFIQGASDISRIV